MFTVLRGCGETFSCH